MAFKKKSDLISWIIIFAVVLLLIELTFFDGDLLFSLFMSACFIYFGMKKWHRMIGKLALIIGAISGIVTIVNMFTFKLFLLAVLGVLVYKFIQSKKHPAMYTPNIENEPNIYHPETLYSKPMLFKNNVLGDQKTPESVYEWEDINIQNGVGDIIVDLSNTVLPKGEAVISIRNAVGNIKIYVPYEIEVKVVHSVILGSVTILQNKEQRLFNESIQYYTSQYDESQQKVKIITSTLVGNIEVKRI
ncbi:cell wall-active antibiotics response protein LiaF [Bacillus massiliigorillae]|uniref:cell wall-active antibiotics response protein LiaF n=1 Tax=Bacillus massiliigorillae TaxID=1243664 RepID=UPI00039C9438|nr:cell wall-active antibiotics response protein LiaF [Bacillus massiliigorillae]